MRIVKINNEIWYSLPYILRGAGIKKIPNRRNIDPTIHKTIGTHPEKFINKPFVDFIFANLPSLASQSSESSQSSEFVKFISELHEAETHPLGTLLDPPISEDQIKTVLRRELGIDV